MSAEKITNNDNDDLINSSIPEVKEKISSGRVDINILIAKVRKKEQQDNKVNLVFFGLFVALVFVVGILLSL